MVTILNLWLIENISYSNYNYGVIQRQDEYFEPCVHFIEVLYELKL